MHVTDSMLLEVIFLFLLFGPLPVAYMAYPNEDRYQVFAFVVAFAVIYGALGFFQQIWIIFIAVFVAWCFALRPVFAKWQESGKKIF